MHVVTDRTADLLIALEDRGLLALVQRIAAEHHSTPADVLGSRGGPTTVAARRACSRALRELGMSTPEIGRLLGRDASTVHDHLTDGRTRTK